MSGMDARRLAMLGEMGLTPLWRARNTPVASDAPVAQTTEAFVADEAPAPSPARPPAALLDWTALKTKVEACVACDLSRTRKQAVFGVGNEQADWMIIGEAPGAEEDARGEPFVGPAGQLLDRMLAAIGLTREADVYIANVLKCRPPGNRNPAPDEVERCAGHLHNQIALVRPKLILAMGRFAAQTLLRSEASIASMRGKRMQYQDVPMIVTYHPAYLLRTPGDKAKAWEDLCFARATMQALEHAQIPAPSPPG